MVIWLDINQATQTFSRQRVFETKICHQSCLQQQKNRPNNIDCEAQLKIFRTVSFSFFSGQTTKKIAPVFRFFGFELKINNSASKKTEIFFFAKNRKTFWGWEIFFSGATVDEKKKNQPLFVTAHLVFIFWRQASRVTFFDFAAQLPQASFTDLLWEKWSEQFAFQQHNLKCLLKLGKKCS